MPGKVGTAVEESKGEWQWMAEEIKRKETEGHHLKGRKRSEIQQNIIISLMTCPHLDDTFHF